MQYRKLGQTDMEVSTVAMGCWAIAGGFNWGDQDANDSIAAIQASLEVGINFFDTAPGYGSGTSEQLVGKGLGSRRKDVYIATKVSQGDLAADDVPRACEQSLSYLGTDYIDLYQVHWPNWDIPMAETAEALLKLKEQGKIRAIGVSNFGPEDMGEFSSTARIESNQLVYNLLMRGIEYDIQPVCDAQQIGILCYSPIMQGLLTGKFNSPDEVPDDRARTRHFSSDRPLAKHGESGCEDLTFQAIQKIREIAEGLGQPMGDVALAWCLHQPAVTSVLAGARNPDQARANARAADLTLDSATLSALDAATAPLKQAMGDNADMWQPKGARIR